MKVALIHDFLIQDGGAERVLKALHEIFPKAPVYTTIFNQKLKAAFPSSEWNIITSPISRIPLVSSIFKYFTLLWPLYFENLDLRQYDVVISDTANFAKGVLTRPNQLHISYIHTPPRFLYGFETETNKRSNWFWKPILKIVDNYLRVWDYAAAQRPDILLTNSKNTAERIKKFYGRKATVVYPPSPTPETLRSPSKPEGRSGGVGGPTSSIENTQPYYLCVGRLVKYKNFDLAVSACSRLKLNLKIIGEGPELQNLKKNAGNCVEFLGRVSDSQLADYLNKCQAVLFPTANEDFGMVVVEALSYGKPVVALRGGGASEILEAGETGEFFEKANSDNLEEVLRNFDATKYDSATCKKRATFFNGSDFKEKILNVISDNSRSNRCPFLPPSSF